MPAGLFPSQNRRMPIIGVRAGVFDLDKFMNDMNKVNATINALGSKGTGVGAASNSAKQAANNFGALGTAVSLALKPLDMLKAGLAFGFGIAGVQIAIAGIKELAAQAYEATKTVQYMESTLAALVTREYARMDVPIAEAMVIADEKAEILMETLGDIAILSPFKWVNVQEMFRFSMAFGSTASEAIRFSKSMLEIAAGTGASGDMLSRMAYNFSQIRLQGKITWLDWRQLAQAGFDLGEVLQVLSKITGQNIKTDEDFNAAIANNIITWDDWADALDETARTRFSGSAERMARTLQGLESNFNDFFVLTIPALLKHGAEEITVRLNRIFDAFRSIRQKGYLDVLGDMFGDWVNSSLSSLERLGTGIWDALSPALSQAFNWGADLIANLAAGIMDTASYMLGLAMDFVGGILSFWLSSNSPPNVAPDIDKWGAATLSAWLHGFEEADWTAFDAINKRLRSVLDIVGSTAGFDMTAALMQAISEISTTGASSINIVEMVRAATGEYGDEMARLVELQLQYADASKDVEDADAAIAAGEQKLSAQVREYNKARRSGASKAELRKLALGVETTRDEIYQAKKLKVEKERGMKQMEKQIKLQEKLVDALIDFAKAQEAARKASEAASEAASKSPSASGKDNIGAEGHPPPYGLSDWTGLTKKSLDEARAEINRALDGILGRFAPFSEKWNIFWSRLGLGISGLSAPMGEFATKVSTWINDEIIPILDRFSAWWEGDGQVVRGNIDSIVNAIKSGLIVVIGSLGEQWGKIWPGIKGAFDTFLTWLETNSPLINQALISISGFISKIGEALAKHIIPAFGTFVGYLASYLPAITDIVLTLSGAFLKLISGDFPGAVQDTLDALGKAKDALVHLGSDIWWKIHTTITVDWPAHVQEQMGDKKNFWEWYFGTFVESGAVTTGTVAAYLYYYIIEPILKGSKEIDLSKFNNDPWKQNFWQWLVGYDPQITKKWWDEFSTDLFSDITTSVNDNIDNILDIGREFNSSWMLFWAELGVPMEEWATSGADATQTYYDGITQVSVENRPTVIAELQKLWDGIGDAVVSWSSQAEKDFADFFDNIKKTLSAQGKALSRAWDKFWGKQTDTEEDELDEQEKDYSSFYSSMGHVNTIRQPELLSDQEKFLRDLENGWSAWSDNRTKGWNAFWSGIFSGFSSLFSGSEISENGKKFGEALLSGITGAMADPGGTLLKFINGIADWVTTNAPLIVSEAAKFGSAVSDAIISAIAGVGPALGGFIDNIAGWITTNAATISTEAGKFGTSVLDSITSIVSNIGGTFSSFLDGIAPWAIANAALIGTKVLELATQIQTAISNNMTGPANVLKTFLEGIPGWVAANAQLIATNVATFASGIMSGLSSSSSVGSVLMDFLNGIAPWVVANAATIKTKAETIGSSLLEGVKSGAASLAGAISSFLDAIPQWIRDNGTAIWSKGYDIGKALYDGIDDGTANVVGAIWGFLNAIPQWLIDNSASFWSKGYDIGKALLDGIADGISALSGVAETFLTWLYNEIYYRVFKKWPWEGASTNDSKAAGTSTAASVPAIVSLSSDTIAKLTNSLIVSRPATVSPFFPTGSIAPSPVNNYNMYVNTTQPVLNTAQSFETMRALYG